MHKNFKANVLKLNRKKMPLKQQVYSEFLIAVLKSNLNIGKN